MNAMQENIEEILKIHKIKLFTVSARFDSREIYIIAQEPVSLSAVQQILDLTGRDWVVHFQPYNKQAFSDSAPTLQKGLGIGLSSPKPDNVNHPSHYNTGKIEVIEFIEDQKLNYHRGNAVKYTCRAGRKDPTKIIEDLKKAIWYLNREIERVEAEKAGRDLIKPNNMVSKEISYEGKLLCPDPFTNHNPVRI